MIKSSEMMKYGKYIDLSFPFKDPCVLICLDKYRISYHTTMPSCECSSAVLEAGVRGLESVSSAAAAVECRPRQGQHGARARVT